MREDENTRNPGRPREYDEDETLTKIMSLFWENGYEGTGLSDIIKSTGLQKGSLYKAFQSKHSMYLRALAHYEKLNVDTAVEYLQSDNPPLKRIKTFLTIPIDAAFSENDRRGCFLCNASADHAANDPETQKLVLRGYGKMQNALTLPISELRPEWSKEQTLQTAQLILVIYSGLRIMARSATDKNTLLGARDTGLTLLA
ncbi:TetR/AcrR family transcriptional regulator [Hirschia litorea]|uniref:TetR/AcrR family transcriptional regulator n=1 Tax=Hirschia litorea TaxID=1199156 RepID=A0ABW2IPJ2_9PROT